MSPHTEPKSPARTTNHWRLLGDLIRPYRRTLIGLGLAMAVVSALPLVGPQILRRFIDAAVEGEALAGLIMLAALYAVLGLANQGVQIVMTWVGTRIAWTVTNDLREEACKKVLSLDMSYHAATSPGALIERIDGDATAIAKFFTDFVIRVVSAMLMTVGAVVLVSYEDWRAGAAMAVFLAVTVTVVVKLRDKAVPAASAERAAFANVVGLVEEQLDGAEDLRALGGGPDAIARHERASRHHVRKALRGEAMGMLIWTSTTSMFVFGSLAMLAGGAWLHFADAITIGTVFLLFQYVQILRRPIEDVAQQLQEVQKAAAGAGRMAQLIATEPTLVFTGEKSVPDGPLPVQFDRVGFAYADQDEGSTDPNADGATQTHAPNPKVLRDVDLTIPAGHVVGLVGRSGSGKTTLARLALRLVDPTEGTIRIGGVDLREVSHESLRTRVAIVTQDVQLFRASIRDNLTLFDPDPPDDAHLSQVLRELGLGDWLDSLPEGLDTVLGDGSSTSAGQSQLLGLARAFLRDPGLVVLDEASSRIDPATAQLVERALDRLLAGRTAIIIAHRLSAVDRADQVVVMASGQIIEHGPRDDLAADPTTHFASLLRAELAAATTSEEVYQ